MRSRILLITRLLLHQAKNLKRQYKTEYKTIKKYSAGLIQTCQIKP